MQKIGIMKTKKTFQCIAVAALGCALVLVGIIGLFLPFVPGGFLIVAGALMLSPRCVLFRRALEKSQARFPFVGRTFMWLSACWETCRRRFTNPSDPGSQFGV
ncbi:MAG: hypothetical protein DMG32_25550 [Acidobacteria bacterium]|nr:MAG: hypothetical protein DMG32_25550 [Acidobacteriota bacterium]